MTDFFKGQYDYIYFFYGLSFLFLALICFTIDKKKSRALPWFLLGSFGLLHGFNEWLDLIVITQGQNKTISLLHPLVLGLSFIMLFEFALVGYVRLEKKILARRWVYLPLAFMIFWGAKSGDNGLSGSIRYFLGFPAGMLSAFVVFRAAKAEHQERRSLYTLSITLAVYAVFAGLIAQKVNQDYFYQVFKLPPQLLRGILALCSAMAVWFYSSGLSGISYQPLKYRVSLKLTKWVIIFTMVVLIGAGWVFTNFLDYYASIQLIKNSKDRANSPLNVLTNELGMLEKMAWSLSRSSVIKNAVFSRKDTDKAASVLDNFRKRFAVESCFLLDTKGTVIASSGEAIPEKIQDKTVIPPVYFKDALSGNTGYHFSLGSKYNERVYYVSYPLKASGGATNGIILVAKIISVKPVLAYRFFSILITFFICILAITLFIALRKRETLIEFIDKANTQLREIDRLKTDFISIVSHELRTPLTAIKNASTILLKGKLNNREVDPNEKELIEIILKNTERQMRMVSDLLDISKIEAGVLPVCIEDIDITAFIKETMDSFQSHAEEKNIGFSFVADSEINVVAVDADHTRRILLNLLSNAVKFTPAEGVITVNVKEEEKEVRVSVADTGIGIPKNDTAKLFNKFYRSSNPAALQRAGTGLGLVITKGLVEAQGGRIWFESKIGKGSTFYFTLPKWRQEITERSLYEKKSACNR